MTSQTDQWLARHKPWVLGLILTLSILLHLIYFFQLNTGPCMIQHRWEETDMNFFDAWARQIKGGDWLSKAPLHPHHIWHQRVAQIYLKAHPEKAAELRQKASALGEALTAERLLWRQWYRGNRFHQEPLYAYLVACTYALLGRDVRWVFTWQMVLGIWGCLLVYFLALRAFGETTGVVAAALYALSGPILFYELVLLRATLLNFTGLGLVLLSVCAMDLMTWKRWALLGAAGGFALLLKVTFVLYLAGTAAVLFFYCRQRRLSFFRPAGAALAGLLLVLFPFLARNLVVGAPVLGFSSIGAHAFVFFNAEDTTADVGPSFSSRHGAEIMGKSNGAFFAAVKETLKTHGTVGSYLNHLWQRFITVWHWYEVPNNANFYYYRLRASILRFLPMTFLSLVPLGIIGLVLAVRQVRQWNPARVFLFLLLLNSLAPLVVFGNLSRYRFLFLAPLIPFTAWAVVKILSWIHARKFLPSGAALVVAVFLTLGIGRPLPPDTPLIRPADYVMVYQFYYVPKVQVALKAGLWSDAVESVGHFLEIEPDAIRRLGLDRKAKNADEGILGRFYGQVRLQYAAMLKRAGRLEAAVVQRRRGLELLKALQ